VTEEDIVFRWNRRRRSIRAEQIYAKIGKKPMIRYLVLFFPAMLFFAAEGYAQKEDSIYYKLTLDEFVVKDTRLNLKNFIRKMESDETFYRAFRNLRKHGYRGENAITLYDKKKNVRASYESSVVQHSDGNCRTMDWVREKVVGNFFEGGEKKKPRFYTAELFDRLFLTHGRVCEGEEEEDSMHIGKADSKTQGYINDLKKLIFKPGQQVDVPFIGKKMAIFSEKMQKYYDYSFTSGKYKGKTDCYIFTVSAKKDAGEGDTVVKFLETFFDKSDFQILGRNYRLKYSNWIFQFDVTMNIEVERFNSRYIASYIHYDGYWDIPFKKPEICVFYSKFSDYKASKK